MSQNLVALGSSGINSCKFFATRTGGSNFVCPDCAKKQSRDSDMWRSLVSESGDQVPANEYADADELSKEHVTGLPVDGLKE